MAMRHNSPCLVAIWGTGNEAVVRVFQVTSTSLARRLYDDGAIVYEAKIYDKSVEQLNLETLKLKD